MLDGILCSGCWDKNEEQYRKITGEFPIEKDPNKPKAVRKEHKRQGVLAFIVYNWNKEEWVFAHANEDLGSPDNQRPGQEQPRQEKTSSQEHNEYTCKRCGTSCWNSKIGKYTIKRIWYSDLNFHEEIHYFSENCSCAEEFKRSRQQTCRQCQKREWPDMRKGWALDYGLRTIFCSSICHYKHHKALWEAEQHKKGKSAAEDIPNTTIKAWTKDTKLYPMELALTSEGKKDFDWTKEASKKEVLTLKEFSKSLKKEVAKSTADPKLSKEEKEMASYFLELAENSEKKATETYESKYGKLDTSQEQEPKKNYWPLIVGSGIILAGIIGLIVWLITRKKNEQSQTYSSTNN
ncbi:hypothetical protein GvMRE_I1g370 [endosymbiont GvMRE of Glomus versiforme]|nr:hypothetical protein GvMRE_I1g370 [endosymbiont GvMRE of Glomus versiforme]